MNWSAILFDDDDTCELIVWTGVGATTVAVTNTGSGSVCIDCIGLAKTVVRDVFTTDNDVLVTDAEITEKGAVCNDLTTAADAERSVTGIDVFTEAKGERSVTGIDVFTEAKGEGLVTGIDIFNEDNGEGFIIGIDVFTKAKGEWLVTGINESAALFLLSIEEKVII